MGVVDLVGVVGVGVVGVCVARWVWVARRIRRTSMFAVFSKLITSLFFSSKRTLMQANFFEKFGRTTLYIPISCVFGQSMRRSKAFEKAGFASER